MENAFKEAEKRRQVQLLEDKSFVFYGASGNGYYMLNPEEKDGRINLEKLSQNATHIIKSNESIKNLFQPIWADVLKYFETYDISWWNEKQDRYFPTGNVLSSQIHCLNHLFALRRDRESVLQMIQPIGEKLGISFVNVFPSLIDKKECYYDKNNHYHHLENYITFEFVYHNSDLLDEKHNQRGAKCTSVDALIYAGDENGGKWLIPIEWKYTEMYNEEKPQVNYKRYLKFFKGSRLQNMTGDFEYDPLYEFGRQTLLMEQLIKNESTIASHFLHIIVAPQGNTYMSKKVEEFQQHIQPEYRKYVQLVTPEQLLNPVKKANKYDKLFQYLETRYWNSNYSPKIFGE